MKKALMIVGSLRNRLCKFFEVSRSGYYDFVKRLGQPEHDAELAKEIQVCQNKTDKTYVLNAWEKRPSDKKPGLETIAVEGLSE